MKNILLIFSFSLIALTVFAQQLPIYSQNQDGNYFTNAAQFAEDWRKNDLATSASLSYRAQWVKVEDAPRTLLGQVNHFNEDLNLILGGTIIQDQTGPTSFSGVYLTGGYAIKLTREWQLAMTLSAGMAQHRIKAADLNFLEQGDIAQTNTTKIAPDVGLAATMYYDKRFFLGISVPQILGLNLDFVEENNDFKFERFRHYYATGGALFDFDGSWLEASAYARFVPNIPLNVGVQVRYEFNEIFWIGVGGTSAKAGSMEGGLLFDLGNSYSKLRLGYGFTNFFESYSPNFGTVHDIKISYAW